MKHITYGNTWWGEQWLNAFTHIDYDNRLPRGRSYANKGAVKNFTVAGGAIHSEVQGSRSHPYKVSIQVPSLPKTQVDILLDELVADPSVIARLLNRELAPSVLTQSKRLGISVFPSQWNDLTMRCSCPDCAVPCKHLAATIYLVSREIDNNPFLVFSIRGVDLVQQLKVRGIHVKRQVETNVPCLSALLLKEEGVSAEVVPFEPAALDMLPYADLPSLSEPLLAVLTSRPAFFTGGDLRLVMQKILTRVAKEARNTLYGQRLVDMPQVTLLPHHCPRITLTMDGDIVIGGINNIHTIFSLDAALAQLTLSDLQDRQPEVAALFHLRMIALHLLTKGAVVPQVFTVEGNELRVRWLPAMLDRTVADQIQRLAYGLPSHLVTLTPNQSLSPVMQSSTLCAVFLGHYMHIWSEFSKEKPPNTKILSLLFSNHSEHFDDPGEGAIGPALYTWLARYHLAERNYVPVLSLNESVNGNFEVALAVQSKATLLGPPVSLHTVLSDEDWSQHRFGVLQTVVLLAEFFPPLDDYLRQGAGSPIELTSEQLPELLFNTLPAIQLLGIRTLLPKALERLLRPRLSMKVSSKTPGLTGGYLGAGDILTFDWRVALGEHQLTRTEFERLVHDVTGVVRFKGEYVYLDPDEIARLKTHLARPSGLSGTELLRIALAGEYSGTQVLIDDNMQQLLKELRETGDVPLPNDLKATLRPYQQRGYTWLLRNLRMGFGSVIADDMGLGKTLQVISTLLKLKEDGELDQAKALVVVPTSLLTNWQKEITRFAPKLILGVFHGSKRELSLDRPDILLTTYGIVRSAIVSLKVFSWRVLVIDEAQNIKNPSAAQTKAIKTIPAAGYIAMSGTPVENCLSEYWSMMDFANRGYLGTLKQFEKEYTTPIQTDRDRQVAERFRRVTAPFLLRRLKSDRNVISYLPDKVESDQYCVLTALQTALYESVVQEGLKAVEAEEDKFKRQGLVLQMILELKQICNHPDQYLKQPAGDPMGSGKIVRLFDLLDDLHASHEKTLIFTQFRKMGELLAYWLQQRYGQLPMFLHGGLSRAKRDAMVERFQTDRTVRVFLLSLKAGGTGLNLTAASNVIHFDLWWNPAVEAQATDRAYRIGQKQNVQVHRFITSATFEERINEMIQRKRELSDMVVSQGEQWIGNLDAQDLNALFSLS
ncbi:DEAD/DEAH box helicase [Candidatus Symbiopectobacterium sp.]|uniref:DEAD/DEAH box helicase n=1 Tax=Candidatus Symbiopectobacterium sp. TaxID=2816440 RepID=UPI0025C6332A|nr:DEAD/DEAH box helicase [Candidatus Symbiopectobacterium sp.]